MPQTLISGIEQQNDVINNEALTAIAGWKHRELLCSKINLPLRECYSFCVLLRDEPAISIWMNSISQMNHSRPALKNDAQASSPILSWYIAIFQMPGEWTGLIWLLVIQKFKTKFPGLIQVVWANRLHGWPARRNPGVPISACYMLMSVITPTTLTLVVIRRPDRNVDRKGSSWRYKERGRRLKGVGVRGQSKWRARGDGKKHEW